MDGVRQKPVRSSLDADCKVMMRIMSNIRKVRVAAKDGYCRVVCYLKRILISNQKMCRSDLSLASCRMFR